jgi:hypothetical protein
LLRSVCVPRRRQIADARSDDDAIESRPVRERARSGARRARPPRRAHREQPRERRHAGLPRTRPRLPPGDGARRLRAGTPAEAHANPDLKYRTPLAPALDGNTVDAQIEQAAFAENAVRYQATLTFLNSKFRGLLTAILGS